MMTVCCIIIKKKESKWNFQERPFSPILGPRKRNCISWDLDDNFVHFGW